MNNAAEISGLVSKKGYEVVRGHLRGPSRRTVQKAFSFYNILPGIIKPIVSLIKFQQQQETWQPEFNLISMAYDEMKVSCIGELDQRLECLSGPSDQAFLLTVKGLVKDFQYPFYSAMDYTLSKESYNTMITELYKIDLTVLLTVKDQGKFQFHSKMKNNFKVCHIFAFFQLFVYIS